MKAIALLLFLFASMLSIGYFGLLWILAVFA